MDLLKYVAPKGFLKRFTAAPTPSTSEVRPARVGAFIPSVPEPIETIVDRYEANLPSIHKLICLNRELLEHRQAQMQSAEALQNTAVRSFRYRALGALPFGTLALEMNQLSQAGLASQHADGVALLSGAAAVLLACFSMVSLKRASQARGQKVVLQVRQDELKGAIERETRAASRTLGALDTLRKAARPIEHDITQVIGADTLSQRAARRPQAFSDVVTPPPGWPSKAFVRPRPMPMNDAASGTTFHRPY